MNGSRQIYRLDDYLQDKAQRAASPLARGGASGIRTGTALTTTGNTPVQTVKPLPVRPPHTVQSPSGSSYNASSASGGQNVTGDIIKPEAGAGASGGVPTQSQMTTAYTKQVVENALQSLLDMQNRKFQYDVRSSPLYSIVQRQAEENARLASGRAYARAKGATGGYGSSYATLAADEAGRQAMRELDDQQLALYEAARAEFEAENASMLEWYNTAKQLSVDAEAREKAEAEKAKAEASGLNESTTNLLLAATENNWYTGTNAEELRARLETYKAADSSIDVDAIMDRLAGVQSAVIADQVAALEKTPTLSGAAEAYLAAHQSGTLDQYAAKISAGAKTAVETALKNADDNEETEDAVLSEAAQAVRDGYMSESDYVSILTQNAKDTVIGIDELNKSKAKKEKLILESIEGVLSLVDNKTITETSAQSVIEMIAGSKTARDMHTRAIEIERDVNGKVINVKTGGSLSESEKEAWIYLYRAFDNNAKKSEERRKEGK